VLHDKGLPGLHTGRWMKPACVPRAGERGQYRWSGLYLCLRTAEKSQAFMKTQREREKVWEQGGMSHPGLKTIRVIID
jgi:hypothetical protein